MTMIARIIRDRVPIYLGDLLLSGEGNGNRDLDIPAIAKINARLPGGTSRSVIGLTQKLNLISDRLVVAWAGNVLQARLLIREISEAVAGGASTWQEVGHVLQQTPESDRNDVSLIGSILVPSQGPKLGLQHFQ